MKMRYLFLLLVLFPIIANTQVGKRIKFRTGTERCMSAGIPVADCFVLSNGQGEFEPKTLADIKTKLGIPDQDFLESGGTPPNSDADEMYHTGDTHIGDATMSGTGKLNVVGVLSARQSIANNNLFISGGNLTATGSNNVGILSGATLTTGTHNVFIKGGAASTTGSDNICIGNTAGGIAATDIDRTVCIGTSTGLGGSPDSSVLIGYEAGRSSVGGVYRNNVCIGYNANKVTSGSGGTGNVIIGSNAGKNMTVSNRLLIDNSSTSTPLIDGNFSTDEVKINGSLWTTDEIRDSDGDAGNNGEVLTSTSTGTNWQQVSGLLETLASGVYTPIASDSVNITDAITMSEAQYMRVGNTVTVSGRCTIDPTFSITQTSFEFNLPIPSNIGAFEDVSGTAIFSGTAGAGSNGKSIGAEIVGIAANDTAKLMFNNDTFILSATMTYHYTYQIIE